MPSKKRAARPQVPEVPAPETLMNRFSGLAIPRPEKSVQILSGRDSHVDALVRLFESCLADRGRSTLRVPVDVLRQFVTDSPSPWVGVGLVAIYLRVSTEEQGRDRGSLPDSLRLILKRMVDANLVPAIIVWDEHTGTEYSRPGMDAMFTDIRALKGSEEALTGIVIEEMDRWGRRVRGGIDKACQATDLGAPVIFWKWRLERADMDSLEGYARASEALIAADDQYQRLQRKTMEGRQGAVNRRQHPGARSWVLYEALPAKQGGKTVHVLHKRADAAERLIRILTALRASPERGTLEELAASFGLKSVDPLITELRRRWLIGHYHLGSLFRFIEDDPELTVATEEEWAELQRLLDDACAPRPRHPRESRIEREVRETSIEYMGVLTNDAITTTCQRRDPDPKKAAEPLMCGKPTRRLNETDPHHLDKDLRICPDGHRGLWPNERVVHARKDGRRSECGSCQYFEYMGPGRRMRKDGTLGVGSICERCGALNWVDRETEPARKKVLERKRPGAPVRDVYKLTDPQLLPGLEVPEGIPHIGRRRRRASPRARQRSLASRGDEPNPEASGPRQTRLE